MTGTTKSLPVVEAAAVGEAEALTPSPFLHVGPDCVYNPLADVLLREGEPGYSELRRLLRGELAAQELPAPLLAHFETERWLEAGQPDGSRAFRLKYVSLEAHTVCNQSCHFCPVSVAPRPAYFMPDTLYERILDELTRYRDTLEAIFMNNYNEPTADRRFAEQVRAIRWRGLPPAVLTNGSGLMPDRVDALCAAGGLRFLSINLSTIDPAKYRRDRGVDQVELVLRNLDYAGTRPVAEEMEIVVLGEGDDAHHQARAEIERRFAGSRFRVEARPLMDRAGYLEVGESASVGGRLAGCENTGPRPLHHLHVTPQGKCVLCCEDYDENYVVGDLTVQSVDEVLSSEAFARLRRWTYGIEEAPAGFICRNCIFALPG